MSNKIPLSSIRLLPFRMINHSLTAPTLPIYEEKHAHDYYEVVYLLRGGASLTIAADTIHIQPQQLILILPMTEHAIYKHTLDTQGLIFGYKLMPIFSGSDIYSEDGFVLFKDENNMFKHYAQLILKTDMSTLTGQYLLNSFIFQLHQIHADEHKMTYSSKIAFIMDQLTHYYTVPRYLTELAEMVDLTPSYLSQLFRQETGCTISEFLRDLRLKHACSLLMDTDLSINDIAITVGYRTPHNFSQQFIKQFGISPREYREGK